MALKDVIGLENGRVTLKDEAGFRENIDALLYDAVFEQDDNKRKAKLVVLKEACKEAGAIPASIQGLYEEMGRSYPGFTVPAINVRGLTYDTSRAIFRKALEMKVGAMIFEIARSEIGYTKQRPLEYATVVLAAAVKEGYKGPVFIQGDHFQLVRKYYLDSPEKEGDYVKGLIKEAIEAEFYNIDVDTSTIVDLEKDTIKEQQRSNFEATAMMTHHIRDLEPDGITVSVGGEIGEIGGKNSTPEELRAYLDGFKESCKTTGISKISVQTGTSHGGVVLPDGSLAQVKIDFETLRTLSQISREEYGLSGCVQHGASTLPEEAFDHFPETETSEVHLATGFQNIIYDSPAFPEDLRKEIYDYIRTELSGEKKETQTDEQFIYSTRKKGFGTFKQKFWDLPEAARKDIAGELESRFELLFTKLKVGDSMGMVEKTVKPVKVQSIIPAGAADLLS